MVSELSCLWQAIAELSEKVKRIEEGLCVSSPSPSPSPTPLSPTSLSDIHKSATKTDLLREYILTEWPGLITPRKANSNAVRWEREHPLIDLLAEAKGARAWELRVRKERKSVGGFLGWWFRRAEERRKRVAPSGDAKAKTRLEIERLEKLSREIAARHKQ